MREIDQLRVERGSLQVIDLKDVEDLDDLRFWLGKSPLERLEGLEVMRQSQYAYDPLSERLPRLFEVVDQI